MESAMNKSLSESSLVDCRDSTPPNKYNVTQRQKRRRETDLEPELNAFREDMKNMFLSLMAEQHEDLKKILPAITEIKKTNSNIESSINYLTEQNKELKKQIERLEIQSKQDRDYITLLEDKIEDLQRNSRKTNIEIKNVPKKLKEDKYDLIKMVAALSKTIGCSISNNDVKDIYRVQAKGKKDKSNTNPPIIVELTSTILRTEFLKMAKSFNIRHKEKLCAKHLGLTDDEYVPIYTSEQLTAKGTRLHFLARDLVKTRRYRFCWTAYGRVYVRKDENSPVIVIKNESQINFLLKTE